MTTRRLALYPASSLFRIHRRPYLVLLLLLTLLVSIANAQQPSPLPVPGSRLTAANINRNGTITGRVTDEAGQPFANIVVYVLPVGGIYEQQHEVATDEAGNFQVEGLSPAGYTVECNAEGYIEDADDDSHAYHVTGDVVALRLHKGGVITGTVTNAAGESLIKAEVTTVRVRDAEGHPVHGAQRSNEVKSDDRGIYRIYGLEAGSYLVGLNHIDEYEYDEQRSDIPIYYPSASLSGAQEVKVFRGAETGGINLIYRREPGHSISGKFSGMAQKEDSDTEAYLKLLRLPNGTVQQAGWYGYKTNGAFTIQGVPDGDYILIGQDEADGADVPGAASLPVRVTVRGSDVSGLALPILPFASISGRVVLQTTLSASTTCKPTRPARLEEAVVAATRAQQSDKVTPDDWLNELFTSIITNAPGKQGDFLLRSIAPGSYQVAAMPLNDDLYVRTIALPPVTQRASQAAKTAGNLITLKSGEQRKDVLITVVDGAASLRGRLVGADAQAKLPEGMLIHLVPAEPERADDVLRYDETAPQSDGTFVFKHLAPGRYRLVARVADGKRGSPSSVATDPVSRSALRREAETSGTTVDLQPCQRLNDFSLRYPSATKPANR